MGPSELPWLYAVLLICIVGPVVSVDMFAHLLYSAFQKCRNSANIGYVDYHESDSVGMTEYQQFVSRIDVKICSGLCRHDDLPALSYGYRTIEQFINFNCLSILIIHK